MKFMLIVLHDEEAFNKIEKEKRQQMLAESIELTHQLHAAGQYLSASPLHPAETAVIVRVREGKPLVTDGPFIETREQIAGYFLVNARNLNEAHCQYGSRSADRNHRGETTDRDHGPA